MRAYTSLKRQSEFTRLYRRGRRIVRGHFVVYHMRRRPGPMARVGIAIGKSVGNAVHRNLTRRRLQGTLDALNLGHACDVDLLFVAKPGAAEATYESLAADITYAVEQALRDGTPRS